MAASQILSQMPKRYLRHVETCDKCLAWNLPSIGFVLRAQNCDTFSAKMKKQITFHVVMAAVARTGNIQLVQAVFSENVVPVLNLH